jgi:hypothetical protein
MAGQAVAAACAPYIEEHPASPSASFRPHPAAFEHCEVSEATYQRVVAEWLRTRPADSPPISSLSLGRAVTFPWISRHVADAALQSPGWGARISRAKAGEREKLARPALLDPVLLKRLAVPFEGTPYRVEHLSYEKVLFGNAGEHSSNKAAGAVKVPFDAQLWLRLAPQN